MMCDREFCRTPYIKVLEELKMDYLMPIPKNRLIHRIIKETKEFPRIVKYFMGPKNRKVEFWLVLVKNKKGEVHTFATNMAVTEKNCEQLVELYRNRWVIETSYRMLSEVKARTCSKNFGFRWFLVLFGLLVRNGYYLMNEIVIDYGHVTLKTFAELFVEVVREEVKPVKKGNG